jgi:hypothetical protein
MKRLLSKYFAIIICCILAISCEIDNFKPADATIQGTLFDHNGQPLQLNHGSEYIRMRELSWIKDKPDVSLQSQFLRVQQDGTYRHTKWFAGEYLMLPYGGNFFPYIDAGQTTADSEQGDLVNISGTTNKDFTVTPYLTIEWVKKPTVTADNYLECTVRFKRNQKAGYTMPDVNRGWLRISRSVNATAFDGDLFTTQKNLSNANEGQEIEFRSTRPLKYTGISYWIRITMGFATTSVTYTNIGSVENCSTIEKISVP